VFQDGSGGRPTYLPSIAHNGSTDTPQPHRQHWLDRKTCQCATLPTRLSTPAPRCILADRERPFLSSRCTGARSDDPAITHERPLGPPLLPAEPHSSTAAPVVQLVRASSGDRKKCTRSEAAGATPNQVESPSPSDFVAPPVYLQAVSRPFELSLQSSLQLSLTVLVCYRSRSHI
jgi:hypothetical protein